MSEDFVCKSFRTLVKPLSPARFGGQWLGLFVAVLAMSTTVNAYLYNFRPRPGGLAEETRDQPDGPRLESTRRNVDVVHAKEGEVYLPKSLLREPRPRNIFRDTSRGSEVLDRRETLPVTSGAIVDTSKTHYCFVVHRDSLDIRGARGVSNRLKQCARGAVQSSSID